MSERKTTSRRQFVTDWAGLVATACALAGGGLLSGCYRRAPARKRAKACTLPKRKKSRSARRRRR